MGNPDGMSLSMLPESWSTKSPDAWYRVVCFRVWRTRRVEGEPQCRTVDLVDAAVVITRCAPRFLDLPPFKLSESADSTPNVKMERPTASALEEGIYCFIVVPEDGNDENSVATRLKVQDVEGLVAVVLGPNTVGRHEYTNIVQFSSDQAKVSGPLTVRSLAEPSPSVDDDSLRNLEEIERKIRLQPSADCARMQLAIRWFRLSFREDGVDAMLAIWVALEALALPDGERNILPLKMAIAEIYGLDVTQDNRFRLGRIYSLRGAIVHNGFRPVVHPQLVRYLQAVFVDVMFHILASPSERRAEAVLNDSRYQVSDWMPA